MDSWIQVQLNIISINELRVLLLDYVYMKTMIRTKDSGWSCQPKSNYFSFHRRMLGRIFDLCNKEKVW